jgi:glycosyltransferase involved in cell wall biosynthesis
LHAGEKEAVRILFVTNMYPSPEMPGYGAFVWQQAQQLRQFGHVVNVVNILGCRSKVHYLRGAFEVLRETRRTAYDVVHAHYGLSALPAWCRLQAPLVITMHGSDVLGGRFESYCSRFIWRFADAVIVVSEEIRRKIPGVVIPCGVDLNVFRPYKRDMARNRLGWPQDKYLILFPFHPARPEKRYDLAKAAVERIAKEGVAVDLVTICSVENCEMPWYYSAADAMILCSNREGSPTSVKEALACNLPVVATDVGDVQEILKEVPGTWICSQEVDDIAYHLRAALAISQRGDFQGRAAMARYDQARTVERIVEVYHEIIHRFRVRAGHRYFQRNG